MKTVDYNIFPMDQMHYGWLAGINYESAADGPGIRTAIFLSGCTHECNGCHNPETWNFHYGKPIDESMIRQIASEIKRRPYLSGITLTGGDPLCYPLYSLNFLVTLKKHLGQMPNIWLYTGYKIEQLGLEDHGRIDLDVMRLISLCDVVVDGPFVKEKADKRLEFRGSTNQRIIPTEHIRFAQPDGTARGIKYPCP